jgi:putative ABC transport system substrate-binding protein
MDRRRFLLTSLAGVLAAPLAAEAQQGGKGSRIGVLAHSSATLYRGYVDALREGLRELGWIEGQNLVIEYRFSDGHRGRLPSLAAELVSLKVDVIVASPTPPAVVAKSATATIPIVMVNAGDPVGVGLVASLARPGGNVTGLSFSVGVDYGKVLELLLEAVPKARRVAILTNPANPVQPLLVRDLKTAGQSLGIPLLFLEAGGADDMERDIERAFVTVAKERVGALLVVADSGLGVHRTKIVTLAAKNRVPAAYGNKEHVDAGGLMSFGPNNLSAWKHAAVFVDRILKGAKPADLPVEQPTKFELVINLKTAKALGLTIPPSLLARADQVIE